MFGLLDGVARGMQKASPDLAPGKWILILFLVGLARVGMSVRAFCLMRERERERESTTNWQPNNCSRDPRS